MKSWAESGCTCPGQGWRRGCAGLKGRLVAGYHGRMGFTTAAIITSTAAAAIPQFMGARASRRQAKHLEQAASQQEHLSAGQADAITETALDNQQRRARNARAELAAVRADAAVANTAQEGSTYLRGVDMATRLQDEISALANEELERGNQLRRQAAYDAWDTRNQARQSRQQARISTVSGLGSLIGGLATGLAGRVG